MSLMDTIKEHPYAIAGGVFAVGAVAIVVINMKSAAASTATTTSGTDTAAEAADASLEAAQLQQQGQLDLATVQANEALSVAQLQAGVQNNQTTAGVTNTGANDTTSEDINAENDETSVTNTQTTADASVAITGITANAQLQTALGSDAANVAVAQANATTQQLISQFSNQALEVEAGDLASVQKTQSNNGLLGGALSVLGSIL